MLVGLTAIYRKRETGFTEANAVEPVSLFWYIVMFKK